ncbi:Sulfurtransferase [Anaerolineales bacterium]|nr:Sulfurtransferase [Anaerolineales bacterium]
MKKNLNLSLILLVVFSMILAACGAPAEATEVVVAPPTEAPVATEVAVVTEAPVVEAPAEIDYATLYAEMIGGLPQGFGGIKPADVSAAMAEATPPFLLDVRDAAELEKDGYIKGAVNIPVREVLKNLDKLPGLDEKIIIYCGSGQRGGMLMGVLRILGYTNVLNMGGGLGAWKTAELPVETGSMPEAPAKISTPIIADEALFTALDESMSSLPDGFLGTKADKVNEMLASATPPTLIDLRTVEEVEKGGYIKDSINIPVGELFTSLDKLPAKDSAIVLYCGSGLRGSIAIEGLRLLGYTNVLNMGGGLGAWKSAGFPVEGIVDWTAVWTDFLTTMPADFYTIKGDVLSAQIDAGNSPFIIDVREPAEIEKNGFIKGAVNLPLRSLLQNLDKLPAQDQPIVVYCAIGHRGAMAMASLRLLGYDARSLGGGFNAWVKASLPVETGKPADPVAGTAATVDPLRLKGLNDYLASLPENFDGIKDTDLLAALGTATPPTVIDVRTADEVKASGYIKGSVFIPLNDLLADMTKLPADKSAQVVTICSAGHRGAVATMALRMLGYAKVNSMFGGLNTWVADGLPVEK